MPNNFVSVLDYGAVGDGLHDDTQAFKDAIAAAIIDTNLIVMVPWGASGEYKITDTLTLNSGQGNCAHLTGVNGAKKPTLKFEGSFGIGILIRNAKAIHISNIDISTTSLDLPHVGVYANGMWFSTIENVSINGTGNKNNPDDGDDASIGLFLRPTVNGKNNRIAELETMGFNALYDYGGYNMGVYWSTIQQVEVGGYTYGLYATGGEGGSGPRTNQVLFNQCIINGNWIDYVADGIGGGNTFMSTTFEAAGKYSVDVRTVSGGTGPVFIGGELSGPKKWRGPGLLLNPVAGTDIPQLNDANQKPLLIRNTDQGSQCYGEKFTGDMWLSDWNTKQDVNPRAVFDIPNSNGTYKLGTITIGSLIQLRCYFSDNSYRAGTISAMYTLAYTIDRSGGDRRSSIQEDFFFVNSQWNNPDWELTIDNATGDLSVTKSNDNADMGGRLTLEIVSGGDRITWNPDLIAFNLSEVDTSSLPTLEELQERIQQLEADHAEAMDNMNDSSY